MAHPIKMPKVAMAMNEGTVTEWFKAEGDPIGRDEPLFSIETEKTAYEVEATASGLLHIVVPPGETVAVEATIGFLAADAAELAELQSGGEATSGEAAPEAAAAAEPPAPASTPLAAPAAASAPVTGPVVAPGGRIKASPLAKRVADIEGIDLSQVTGTGPGGRIKKRDIEAYQRTAAVSAPVPAALAGTGALVEKARVPMAGMRKRIAQAMRRAMNEAAHCHIFGEIDVTETLAVRRRLVEKAERLGTKVSLNAFFMKAMAVAARSVPIANATVAGDEIILWESINIGMAVAVDGETPWDSGLLVPVVKNVQSKGLVEIDLDIRRLTDAARNGTLTQDDLSDGTMTLSSTAGFWPGWATSTPLLNVPQVMIVQPATAVEKPVVVDGEIAIRTIMPIALTMDHRALDGVPFSKFFSVFHECIRDPETMLA